MTQTNLIISAYNMCKPVDCSRCSTYSNNSYNKCQRISDHLILDFKEFSLLTETSAGRTWIGCGLHIPYAMSLIPKDQWCTCVSESGIESEYPPKFGDGVASEENELFVKIYPRESLA